MNNHMGILICRRDFICEFSMLEKKKILFLKFTFCGSLGDITMKKISPTYKQTLIISLFRIRKLGYII